MSNQARHENVQITRKIAVAPTPDLDVDAVQVVLDPDDVRDGEHIDASSTRISASYIPSYSTCELANRIADNIREAFLTSPRSGRGDEIVYSINFDTQR